MRILVTGSNGFVGTYLLEELSIKGKDAWGIDRESHSEKTISADIMDEPSIDGILQQLNPDFVLHLAGIANVDHSNKSLVYDINFRGTLNLLNACVQLKKIPRFVFISSSQVYGNVPLELLPIDESFPLDPVNHYGASKAAGELAVKTYGCEYGMEYVILRPFNHTGPGQTDKFVIPKIVNAFNRDEKTLALGNIHTIRDFSDVRDVVKAYDSIIDHFKNGSIYNIASEKGITIASIVEKIIQISGKAMTIDKKEFLVRKNEIQSIIGNAQRIKNETGWRPLFTIDDTLKAMLISK